MIDIGGGLAVAFKIESHNHPSAVEPYQGAATGVGGIMRDIFAMGARPIAALDSLRFGDLSDDRVKYLFDGIVRGIGDYGNCLGVPTVAGEVYFDNAYKGNPLVNAMTVGIVRHDRVAHAVAKSPGASVFIIGSSTGRDGIHGATFASEEIGEKSEAKRPHVQVGDPFTEKLIMEATLEIIQSGCAEGVQDMGAAGITSSASEVAAKSNLGIELDLDKAPLREEGMIPYEIMLSESQERMLIIAKSGREDKIKEICDKWEVNRSVFGTITEDGNLRVRWKGNVVADIPAGSLNAGQGAPVYEREAAEPAYLKKVRNDDLSVLPAPENLTGVLERLLTSPNIAKKSWIYEQYDTMVQTNTLQLPGGDAAVIRIEGTSKALAMKTDGNGRFVYLNPRRGAGIAVAESARNVACTGAKPVAITNCLNFGNPYKPDAYWQFKEAVLGIGDACRALATPVTGGNVSFYNENPDGAIYPTPVIGMLGILDDVKKMVTAHFKNPGDIIFLAGENKGEIGGSEYLQIVHHKVSGDCPSLGLPEEKNLQEFLVEAAELGLLQSAHDISEGGLAVALTESCILNSENRPGAITEFSSPIRPDFLIFGEDQSRAILSVKPEKADEIRRLAEKYTVPTAAIGIVTKQPFQIYLNERLILEADINELSKLYESAIEKEMIL
ncbi:phosphoribosylformylglycinamidine synthase 2 [bacterium BMS3Abin05]|nr:phosphoribosylformylglycinamidine synthase 2 [bacterium BMS3Abin05]